MILYRAVGLQELELIYDGGMKAFPARLPQQPIFYPVLDLEYAREIASDWNTKSGQFAGYVTQFKVEDDDTNEFEKHTVGGSRHQELWIPAEAMDEFNKHIIGHIKVLEAHFGDAFQGFVPEEFGLQGKDAVAQFTLLANSYIYKRMDFYLEVKRNHKAVFLNYPFWQKHDFKNQGLKEKVLQAIKEVWLTSFPKIPLPMPVQEDAAPARQLDSHSLVSHPVQEDAKPIKQTDAKSLVSPHHEDTTLAKQTDSISLVNPVHEQVAPLQETDPQAHIVVNSAHQDTPFIQQTESHLSQGIELGLSGKYHEAIGELSRTVEEDPNHVIARTSLGIAFHRSGEDDRALSCYESALNIDPKSAEAHYFRANILYSRENVREAIAGYTIAIGLEPELIEAHQKPVPQDRLTDYTHAPAEIYWIAKTAHRILALNRSLETNPGQVYLFKERAAEYYRLQNYEKTIADYSSYLANQPDDASAHHFRGLAYEQIGQTDRALEDYQRAISINPQLSDVYINRGVTFGQMGNFRQSIVSLTEGIRLTPQNPNGYFNRGITYFQQGDFLSAIDDFSNVIRLFPSDESAYYWRGISNEQAGRQREAIADYTQFLVLSHDANAREEIEQKLSQWNVASDDPQTTNPAKSENSNQDRDLYEVIVALGERAIQSTWVASGVDCYGEHAGELYAYADNDRPIQGRDLLQITSGIYQTMEGDFQAWDPGATSHWILVRAWNGRGFYIETNDPEIKKQLQSHFQMVEEVEGADSPYEGLFIPS